MCLCEQQNKKKSMYKEKKNFLKMNCKEGKVVQWQ